MPDSVDELKPKEPLEEGRAQAPANPFWANVRSQLRIEDEEIDGGEAETEGDDFPTCKWLEPAKYWEKRTK